MAPKAKRARGSGSGARQNEQDDELVRRLTARLPRAELESLVVSHVRSGATITCAELEERLPERLRSHDVQRTEVRAGASRVNTGLFDAIDNELLINILARLDPISRVRAVSRVCKPWRGLRHCAELFHDIDGSLSMRQLEGLVAWLPEKGKEVRKVTVRADKDVHARAPAALLAKLPSLTELTLQGPKITATALAAAAKASGSTLRSLKLLAVKATDATHLTHAAVADAAKKLPLLETLALPSALMHANVCYPLKDQMIDAESNSIFRALSEARNGGAPLLRELLVRGGVFAGSSPWVWVYNIGKALPELEVLHSEGLNFQSDFYTAAPSALSLPWAPMPRLRELRLAARDDYHGGSMITSEQLRVVLRLAFDAAPNLEIFHFDRGNQWVSQRELKMGKSMSAQAALGDALQLHPPPQSLRMLCLKRVDVAADDLEGLDLPILRKLMLCRCGAQANLATARLAAKYPPGKLKVTNN